MGKRKKVAVIGAGAAGYFAAISVKQHHPATEVILFEKTAKVLSKVKISGGGSVQRHPQMFEVNDLIKAYPAEDVNSKPCFMVLGQRHRRLVYRPWGSLKSRV